MQQCTENGRFARYFAVEVDFFFYYLQNPDSSHTRVNFGVCWWWGCLHSADLWSRRRCTSSAPKETEDSRMKGGVRQRKQKKEEEQSKSEVWKFVEMLKVLKMDCHSVVGSGNYWVTFVAQSQFVLIRCLWTLILKAWRPLRVGASSSIDGGSEFQVLTYPCCLGYVSPSLFHCLESLGIPSSTSLKLRNECSRVAHRCN